MNRIFSSFLIILGAVFLFLLPVTAAVLAFRTDLREDTFPKETIATEVTGNVTLTRPIFDDDTNTITILSDLSTDAVIFASYNTTSRRLDMTGFTPSENRTLTVTYDIDALVDNPAINTLMDILPYFWILMIIGFPGAAVFAVFTGRVR